MLKPLIQTIRMKSLVEIPVEVEAEYQPGDASVGVYPVITVDKVMMGEIDVTEKLPKAARIDIQKQLEYLVKE